MSIHVGKPENNNLDSTLILFVLAAQLAPKTWMMPLKLGLIQRRLIADPAKQRNTSRKTYTELGDAVEATTLFVESMPA
jgi:hypothetical protein